MVKVTCCATEPGDELDDSDRTGAVGKESLEGQEPRKEKEETGEQ